MFTFKKSITILALITSFFTFSQREATKTLTFDKTVKDLIIVPFNGISVISEGENVHGYDPNSDKIIWSITKPKINLKALPSQLLTSNTLFSGDRSFSIIKDTPFVQYMFNEELYVYNSYNGEIIFKPQEKDRYFQAEYLFNENALLLKGISENNLIIAKYSLEKKSTTWKTVVSKNFKSLLGGLLNLKGDFKAKDFLSELNDKMTYSDSKIFTLIKSGFYVLDRNNGNVLWLNEDGNINDFKTDLNATKVLLISKKGGLLSGKIKIDLKDSETGESILKEPINTKYLILFEDWQDRMLLAHYKGFNFYDYKTGKKLWKKDPKGKGIKSVLPIDKDFLYVYDDEMMLIDENGQKLWRGDVTISDNDDDPIFFLEKTKNNRILYVTSTYANMVDYKTGKKVWSSNLKLNEKRPTFADYDAESGNFIVFNDEELYKFNENSEKRPKPFSKLKLKSEKTISSMILFKNNISISGQSEVVGVDFDGKVIFHNKYKQPGEFGRKFVKGLSIAGKIASGVGSAEVTVTTEYKDANGNTVKNSNTSAAFGEKTKAIAEAGYVAADVVGESVKNRFNAMKETDNYSLIFAKGEENIKLLIKVNKETGEEMDKIILENNKPIYDIDYATDDIYYSQKNKVKIFKNK